MAEKRYKMNKYVHCYCAKDVDILVGSKTARFVNTFLFTPVCLGFCVLIATGTAAFLTKIAIIACIIVAPTLLSWSLYSRVKKDMLGWGHSEECSRKIARLVMLHDSTWSEFKIMDVNQDK